MKNIDKKRNVYRKRNMIMIFVMHILLSSFLVGCENKSSMWLGTDILNTVRLKSIIITDKIYLWL